MTELEREKGHTKEEKDRTKLHSLQLCPCFELVVKRCVLIFWRALGTTHTSNMKPLPAIVKCGCCFLHILQTVALRFGYFWPCLTNKQKKADIFLVAENEHATNKQKNTQITLHFMRMRISIAQMHRHWHRTNIQTSIHRHSADDEFKEYRWNEQQSDQKKSNIVLYTLQTDLQILYTLYS